MISARIEKANMNRIIKIICIASFAVFIILAVTRCLYNRPPIKEGFYTVDRVYIDGTQVEENHQVFTRLPAARATWRIESKRATVSAPALPGASIWRPELQSFRLTADIRVRRGYIEQRRLKDWIRENGSAASKFVSTRIEKRQIIIRYGERSDTGIHFGGSVYVYYTFSRSI